MDYAKSCKIERRTYVGGLDLPVRTKRHIIGKKETEEDGIGRRERVSKED